MAVPVAMTLGFLAIGDQDQRDLRDPAEAALGRAVPGPAFSGVIRSAHRPAQSIVLSAATEQRWPGEGHESLLELAVETATRV